MRLECKMTRVQQNDLCLTNIPLKSLGTWWDKELMVLAPNREQTRLLLSKVRLPRGVRRNVVPIIVKDVELDVDNPWSGYKGGIKRPPQWVERSFQFFRNTRGIL